MEQVCQLDFKKQPQIRKIRVAGNPERNSLEHWKRSKPNVTMKEGDNCELQLGCSLSSSGMHGEKKEETGQTTIRACGLRSGEGLKVRRLELLSSAVLIIRSVWNPYGPRISRLVGNNNK
ncbi:hypothetical protein NPIL_314661 [Nephila pilipes]|uniref:Uncharacterized protein n=1 Tax=Nephila pilipes TaxID=299642 RepID=A0A8X6PK63_NEPPI|nr:hypothetical protein NPIL_314661 [Nephila pilipes]